MISHICLDAMMKMSTKIDFLRVQLISKGFGMLLDQESINFTAQISKNLPL